MAAPRLLICEGKYYLLLALLLAFTPVVYADGSAIISLPVINGPPTLKFCYEDKQLLPYFTGNGRDTPLQPGATIEHLRLATEHAGVSLQLIRLPWLRCLQQLESNDIDALVAAFVPERAHFTVYPMRPNGEPNPEMAINQMGLCLAHRYDNPLQQKIQAGTEILTISRPLGYRPIPFPANSVLIGADSPKHALELVVSGRVDATTVLCQLNGLNAKERHFNMLPIQILYPPLHHSTGYLMFSKRFYQQYPKQAEQLWQALPSTLNKESYLHYMDH
jgi:polar amino acid transport system substrate-binding protein